MHCLELVKMYQKIIDKFKKKNFNKDPFPFFFKRKRKLLIKFLEFTKIPFKKFYKIDF